MYRKRSQTHTSLKPMTLTARRRSQARAKAARRLSLAIFFAGPVLAGGLMTAIYAAIGPDPRNEPRPSAVSRQQEAAQQSESPAPVSVKINGQIIPLPSSGRITTNIPYGDTPPSVEVVPNSESRSEAPAGAVDVEVTRTEDDKVQVEVTHDDNGKQNGENAAASDHSNKPDDRTTDDQQSTETPAEDQPTQ